MTKIITYNNNKKSAKKVLVLEGLKRSKVSGVEGHFDLWWRLFRFSLCSVKPLIITGHILRNIWSVKSPALFCTAAPQRIFQVDGSWVSHRKF